MFELYSNHMKVTNDDALQGNYIILGTVYILKLLC